MKLSGIYTQTDLDTLCEELGRLRRGDGGHLDLSELGGLDPAALAVLLSTIGPIKDGGLRGFVPPVEGGCPACLQTEVLRALLGAESGHWHLGSDGSIMGSEVFSDQEGVYRSLKELAARLGEIEALPRMWQGAMHSMAFDLATNVLRHSGAAFGVMVVEIDRSTGGLVLAVADGGVGIRESLARNPELIEADDLSAIRSAMSPQATGEPGRGAGMGLFLAQNVVRNHGGALLVRSGTACREVTPHTVETEDRPNLQGTLVAATVNTARPLDYGSLDEELANPRGLAESPSG